MNLRHLLTALFIFSGFAPATLLAVDGVILIDQNKALAGSVTPGDTPGFPVVISQPGSYRLSGNLTVPEDTLAIQINADNVTLDLNGFTIKGSGIFPRSLFAINGDNRRNVRVHNGFISGFSSPIDFLGTARLITIENLQIDGVVTTTDGQRVTGGTIRVGRDLSAGAIVRGVITTGQIQITCPSLVTNVTVGSGVVEMNVPFDGTGFFFPMNCKGDNVVNFF